MKLAILIQCHKLPKQLNIFLDTLKNDNIDFYIHVDKKSDIQAQIQKRDDIFMLPDDLRVDVKWGQFSQVEATLNLINFASVKTYDYYWLVSGQDFPIYSAPKIVSFLEHDLDKQINYINLMPSHNNGLGYNCSLDKRNEIKYPEWVLARNSFARIMRRLRVFFTGGYKHTFRVFKRKPPQGIDFYFGSSWWCLHKCFIEYLSDFLNNNPDYISFFQKSSCPDESFFQSVLMSSPFRETRQDYLHYVVWQGGASSPRDLTVEDFSAIVSSDKLMTRKINGDIGLIDKLIKYGKEHEVTA